MKISTAQLPTRYGTFKIHIFHEGTDREHIALTAGQLDEGCLVRIHSECATGDIFGSCRCDCRDQLEESLRRIAQEGGVLVYMRGHEGRGIGLLNKIKAYKLQEHGMDTVDANLHLGLPEDARDYTTAIEILRYFGLKSIRLLTNNPGKCKAVTDGGLTILECVPLWTTTNPHNVFYIETKKKRMGHGNPL